MQRNYQTSSALQCRAKKRRNNWQWVASLSPCKGRSALNRSTLSSTTKKQAPAANFNLLTWVRLTLRTVKRHRKLGVGRYQSPIQGHSLGVVSEVSPVRFCRLRYRSAQIACIPRG